MDGDCDGGAGIVVAGRREMGERGAERGEKKEKSTARGSAVHKEEKKGRRAPRGASAVQGEEHR
ncbi:hypothetical protein Q73_15525, partial [Bacillus coahuilensis m2-6]